jgi:hypothetical protein
MLDSPLGRSEQWDQHLKWLWAQIKPHTEYVKTVLACAAWADVCLGCLSNCRWPVLEARSDGLEIVRQLPLSISFNFTASADV